MRTFTIIALFLFTACETEKVSPEPENLPESGFAETDSIGDPDTDTDTEEGSSSSD